MMNRRIAVVVAVLILATALGTANTGRTQPDPIPSDSSIQPTPAQQDGIEVLARGPIHEAFAEPVDSQPKPSQVVPKQPPDPIEELPPDQKPAGDNVQWIPGYWGWDDDGSNFIWVSGVWRNNPPGRQWLPGHWDKTPGGWQWSPGVWGVQGQQQLEFLPPPPQPLPAAVSVPAPDNNSVFVPGTWVYRDTRYLWRPGYWVAYRTGWVWIPAHYVWTPAGYVFVDGYWDFELVQRGLLFAPVYVTPGYWTRPNWVYRPAFVVATDFLLTALFLRPGRYHYYFGDYFEPDYRRRGFVAWVDYHRNRFGFDPLFSYYRWQHRDDRRWERDLRGLYAARFSGTAPRPPHTLGQQNTLVQNITINRNANITNLNAVAPLTPLTKVNQTVVKLQPVSREQRVVAQRSIQQLRDVSRERAQLETQILARGSAPRKPADLPHVVNINLPKPAVSARVSEQQQPPPPPVVHGRPQINAEIVKPQGTPFRPENKLPTTAPKTEPKPEPKLQPRPEARPPATPPKPAEKPPATPPKPAEKPHAPPKPPEKPKPPEARPETKPQPKSDGKPPSQSARFELRPEPRPQPKNGTPSPSVERRPPAPGQKLSRANASPDSFTGVLVL
jgi:hypothetical protein